MPDNFNIDDILAEYADGKNTAKASDGTQDSKITAPTEQKPAEHNNIQTTDNKTERPRRPRPEGAMPNGERPRRPRPEGAPNGERPRRPRPEGAVPNGERPRRPRPESAVPNGERPRRPRPEGTAPNGERPRRPRPEGAAPNGERPRRPRPEGAAPNGERPRRPRPEGAVPNGERPRRPRPEGALAEIKRPRMPLPEAPSKKRRKKSSQGSGDKTNTVRFGGVGIFAKIKQYRFLFEELTKRDFKKKYKRTALGVAWSVIAPFMSFLIYLFVFSYLFQRNIPHYTIYLLSGTLMYSLFTSSTTAGMFSMYSNAGVISKVKVPKTIFLLSSNVACIFNFLLTMVVFFGFVAFDGLPFGPHMFAIAYPVVCMLIFNIGVGYILSSLFVFFRDTQYLYNIFTQLLMYLSAIFYTIDRFPENLQIIFLANPIYQYIQYVRSVVINGVIPGFTTHLICLGFALVAFVIGYIVHKKTEQKFIYYF